MPIPKKIVLFRDQTQCYPVDAEGKIWHIWDGPRGPLCEIIFEHQNPKRNQEDAPQLVLQDDPDYVGLGPVEHGYHKWGDHRTRELENPYHRTVAVLFDELVSSGLLNEPPSEDLVQRLVGKVQEAQGT